jgi:hypothetical protein
VINIIMWFRDMGCYKKFLQSNNGGPPSILATALGGEAYDPMSNTALIPLVRIDGPRGEG